MKNAFCHIWNILSGQYKLTIPICISVQKVKVNEHFVITTAAGQVISILIPRLIFPEFIFITHRGHGHPLTDPKLVKPELISSPARTWNFVPYGHFPQVSLALWLHVSYLDAYSFTDHLLYSVLSLMLAPHCNYFLILVILVLPFVSCVTTGKGFTCLHRLCNLNIKICVYQYWEIIKRGRHLGLCWYIMDVQ